MQMMSWSIARLGSRFGLLFEPYRRRVMHSALGRFLDEPLDLAVGLIEPDGAQRVLPFTTLDTREPGTSLFYNCEQFDRINSVTYRAYSERYRLRFEFNVHSVFYPQDRRLCLTPAFYLEMRVHPVAQVRHEPVAGPVPSEVTLFIRMSRPGTTIASHDDGSIDLSYQVPLSPRRGLHAGKSEPQAKVKSAEARERIVALNEGTTPTPQGDGLQITLPITEIGSGTKWRLVWASHVADPVLRVRSERGEPQPAVLAYNDYFPDVQSVVTEAIQLRDDRLALSRRFEKLLDQAPLDRSQQHLVNFSFQNYLSNTFWCTGNPQGGEGEPFPWFSVWEGSSLMHSSIDVEYNATLFALSLWPDLLRLQLAQWRQGLIEHTPSTGGYLAHDLGVGCEAQKPSMRFTMPVEENANYLLMLQAYTRWTGDLTAARAAQALCQKLVSYLLWVDRQGTGYPDEGVSNTLSDAGPAARFGRKQTYLAIKRLAALRAAGDLFAILGDTDAARLLDLQVEQGTRKVERSAWRVDHFAVAADDSAVDLIDPDTGQPSTLDKVPNADSYSIHTANGLLLPMMVGQPAMLDKRKLQRDLISADRENQGRYADGHTSDDVDAVRVSLNVWRDLVARYLGMNGPSSASQYWDLQVMSNTANNSFGFSDAYLNDVLAHYPRGVVTLGYFLATPRLMIDRLAPGGSYITVDPDRHMPQRWPLLPLADWPAGKVPVCVVDADQKVFIEAETDPVIIHGHDPEGTISGITFIG